MANFPWNWYQFNRIVYLGFGSQNESGAALEFAMRLTLVALIIQVAPYQSLQHFTLNIVGCILIMLVNCILNEYNLSGLFKNYTTDSEKKMFPEQIMFLVLMIELLSFLTHIKVVI